MSGQADALASLGVLVVDDEADVRELLVEYFRPSSSTSPRRPTGGRRRRRSSRSRPATAWC